jgi:hypothetical protein
MLEEIENSTGYSLYLTFSMVELIPVRFGGDIHPL